MAKRDNKSHHDKGGKLNNDRQVHANSFIMQRDPRLNQQQITEQNLAQNDEDGNKDYFQSQIKVSESVAEYNKEQKGT
ncbi:hypothetical protein ACFSKI_22285 [Pseudogracilibacillus auburnensis]|uniref:hypothetical protein n=1 Tax=Pseudogracilibacillus auburnensis TaxID=1494959 RepID=UPI001A97232E|nr:hypothetical protein [Pseudogracilibacillus auburnensis]MBO1003367.1 hypothetical protein [Pseudogracilibacillus auburnensis]